MDDVQVGFTIRAVRLRRGLSQTELAAAAGVSDSVVSLIERGALEAVSLRLLRRLTATLGMSLPFAPRWRGAELAKLLDEAHARMCRLVVAKLKRTGWVALPEFTYSVRGERGSIDILAWHPATRCLLIIEVKTALVDLQDLFSAIDRKLRLAPSLVLSRGWRPAAVAAVLVVPDETWARRLVASFAPLFDAAVPARTVAVRRWLAAPRGNLRGVWFLADSTHAGVGRRRAGALRVRRRPKRRVDRFDEASLAETRG